MICALSGCWIISAFEIHSRYRSLIMTVFAHDSEKEEEIWRYYYINGGMNLVIGSTLERYTNMYHKLKLCNEYFNARR